MTLDHVGIAVRSIDRVLAFYKDILGVEPIARTVVEHENVEAAVLPTEGGRVELLEPTCEDSVIGRFLERRGEGLHHLAVQVEDLDAAADAVRRSGRRLVTDRVQTGAEGYRYVFVHPSETGGLLLELVERRSEKPDSVRPVP